MRRKTCSTIWAAERLPFTPLMPLAQKRQPTGQPTCELMHAVRRSPSGIMTHSATLPSGQVSKSFCVPSLLAWWVVTAEVANVRRWPSRSWSRLARLVMRDGSPASLP